ncbi:hypothetical protein ACJMK2_006637 [Sinanodonta woodiana]|uniref:Uncharacterized protein n=1 Tax=Sinanodonta woodiana TaxID=1069815 RepID=A0ABD3VV34_SINWO
MESCHSVSRPVATVPPTCLPTYRTLGQLIQIIEKLSETEDVHSILKKIVHDCDETSLTSTKKVLPLRLDPWSVQRLSEILARLNHSRLITMATDTDGTKNASSATSSGCSEGESSQKSQMKVAELELALKATVSQDNSQLIRKLRDLEQKCKSLQEKNKKFLEKNMELTTANRNLRDDIKKVDEENKKLQELREQNKRKANQLSRQLSQERLEKGTLELQLQELDGIRHQVAEQTKSIAALKQTIAEKDRRMELLQHRKKRRLRNSHDQLIMLNASLEEDRSLGSECSFSSSVSAGTSSLDSLQEELPLEEVQKGYRKLMKEHLKLERSTALLQTHLDCRTDPYRYKKMKTDLETELFVARCRIEQLENLLESKEGCDYSWVLEKDQLSAEKQSLLEQVQNLEMKLEESQEQIETMEFQLLEMDNSKQPAVFRCDVATSVDVELAQYEDCHILEGDPCQKEIRESARETQEEMAEHVQENYRDQIWTLQQQLEGMLENRDQEQVRVLQELEKSKQMAQELQSNISDLQQQKAKLQEKVNEYQLQSTLTSEEREELLRVQEKLTANEDQGKGSVSQGQINLDDSELNGTNGKINDDIDDDAHVDDSGSEGREHSKDGGSEISENSNFQGKKSYSDLSWKIRTLQDRIEELEEENDVLKYELVECSGFESSDRKTFIRGERETEEELDKMRQRMHQADVFERQVKDKLKLAENTINDLEASEAVIREKLEEATKEKDKGDKMIIRLHARVKELQHVIADKELIEHSLQEQMKYLKDAEEMSSRKIADLELNNQILQQRLDLREELMSDLHLVETLKEKVITMEMENQELKAKVMELEESEEILKENWKKVADEEANRKASLEEKIKLLSNLNKDLKLKLQERENEQQVIPGPNLALELSSASEDANNQIIEQLNAKVEELEQELTQATEDNYLKFECLENKITSLQENEGKLKKIIWNLKNQERAVWSLLANMKSEVSVNDWQECVIGGQKKEPDDAWDISDEHVIGKQPLNENPYMNKMEIPDSGGDENKLLESVGELVFSVNKLKEELEKERENNEILSQRVRDLETNETEVRNSFISRITELEKHEEELMEKIKYLECSETASQENSDISRTLKNNDVRVEVAHKLESFVKVEKELNSCLPQPNLENEGEEEDVSNLKRKLEFLTKELMEANENLKKCSESKLEMSNLVEQYEKDNKVLNDKLRKQEKRLKKNQRNDNMADYDSLARELVTYRNEVEQLRTENSDLHDRVIQLDNSENQLQKKLEYYEEIIDKYEIDLERLKGVEQRLQIFEDAECKLMDRVCELEEIEIKLTEELKSVRETCSSSQIMESDSNQNSVENTIKMAVGGNSELAERVRALEKVESNLRNELKIAKEKCDIFSNRVRELEKIELRLREDLRALRQNMNSCRQDSVDSAYESIHRVGGKFEMCDKCISTNDDESGNNSEQKPLSGLFARIQDLELTNQELTEKLSHLTATDEQVRYLSEKVKLLEQAEDSLMERVMELEDKEDHYKREIKRLQNNVESEKDLEDKLGELEHEKLKLRNSIDFSDKDRADLALRLTAIQKQYEEEKKKVEALLKGEEKLMKSLSSEKRALAELEKELMSTQEKLEELQTDYENKLSEISETEKLLKEELNNQLREKVGLLKKAQEYEETARILTEEIEACRLSESRMFARLQDLNAQNEELERRLKDCGHIVQNDSLTDVSRLVAEQDTPSYSQQFSMSDNPNVESENPSEDPLSSSVFSEKEQHFLKDPVSESSLMGSMPLNMLRKLKEFSEKEIKYRTKIEELNSQNVKLVRKIKILEGKMLDMKCEIQELQNETLHLKETTFSFSSTEKSGSAGLDETTGANGDDHNKETSESIIINSNDNLDMTVSDKTEDDNRSSEIFQSEESNRSFDSVTNDQLILSVKLFEQKEIQDREKISELTDKLAAIRVELVDLVDLISSEESFENFMEQVNNFKRRAEKEMSDKNGTIPQKMLELVHVLVSLRQRLEALQNSETKLRISLAELQIQMEREIKEKATKSQVLEDKLTKHTPRTSSRNSNESIDITDTSAYGENVASNSGSKVQRSNEAVLWRKLESPITPLYLADISSLSSPTVRSPAIESDSGSKFLYPERHSLKDSDLNLEIGSSIIPEKYDTETLLGTINSLQTSVRTLREKVNLLESERNQEAAMMEEPEGVLKQRIREMEKLEKHLKQQVLDLENDREELHNIARKDKSIIHDQKVQIRELQLSEKNMKEQINRFEQNENALYCKVDELENEVMKLQDRIKELEILESRLKELVKKYRLDEKILVAKSSKLESSVQEMNVKTETIVQKVQNLETEKSAFSERSEYLHMRVKEMENAESDLVQKLKSHENMELSLQTRISELEMFAANAQARVMELEAYNNKMTQQLHQTMEDNSSFMHHIAQLQYTANDLEREVLILRETEKRLKEELEKLTNHEQNLQRSLHEFQIKVIESAGKIEELEKRDVLLKERLGKLQRNENTLKYRIQELEYNSGQGPVELTAVQKEKLPRKLEDCQRRIIALQVQNNKLQSRLQQYQSVSVNRALVQIPAKEYKLLQAKASLLKQTELHVDEAEQLNTHLRQIVQQLREGKDISGHEVELEVLRKRLEQSDQMIKMLQDHISDGQWNLQGYTDPRGTQSSLPDEGLTPGVETGMPSPRGYDAQSEGSVEEEILEKTRTVGAQSGRTDITTTPEKNSISRKVSQSEDSRWRDMESHQTEVHGQRLEAMSSRGGKKWINVGKATSLYATKPTKSHRNLEEELELGVNLMSETDSQVFTRNDNDSSPASPYMSGHGQTLVYDYIGSSVGAEAPHLPHMVPQRGLIRSMDNFGDPHFMPNGFVLDSGYIDTDREVLLQQGRSQKGGNSHIMASRASALSTETVADSGRGTGQVLPGQSLREKIVQIERQLQVRESDSGSREINPETDILSWKSKLDESNRKLELTEKENKHNKDQINKLERDLENKTRQYMILETFLSKVEKILEDYKNTPNMSDLVQRIDNEVSRTRVELVEAGHRPEDVLKDLPAMQAELSRKERELTAKHNEVDSLTRELRHWQQECRAIEDMRSNALDSLRGLELEITDLQHADIELKELKDEYNLLRGQIDEMQLAKQMALANVGPIKSRIAHLQQKCNEKDEMIRRLVHELRRLKAGAKPSPLLEELCRLEIPEDPDLNPNLMNSRKSSSSSLTDSCEHLACMSDTELVRDSGTRHPHRPRSADYFHHNPRHIVRHLNGTPMHLSPIHRNLIASNSTGPILTNGHGYMPSSPVDVIPGQQFIAILDYEPALFSRSGRQRLELPLKEGDIVTITGPLSQHGYYEAEHNGRIGLVPANYLQPVNQPSVRNRPQSVPQFLDNSPEKIAQMYSQLKQVHRPYMHGILSTQPQLLLMNGHHSSEMVPPQSPVGSRELSMGGTPRPVKRQILKGPPAMPDNFHVEKIISNSSLMLSWRPPILDELGCSNNAKVIGYRIYMNGKICQQPASPHLAKTVVENVDVHSHHRFGIQTLSSEGLVSDLYEIMYEGVEEEESSESITNDEGNNDTDLRKVLDPNAYITGPKRTFMGLYDYDPSKHSPQDYTECELSFKAGDVIAVYGQERPDGFYHGEINGKRGLVPASFMEEIPQAPPRSKKANMKGKKVDKDGKSSEQVQKKR